MISTATYVAKSSVGFAPLNSRMGVSLRLSNANLGLVTAIFSCLICFTFLAFLSIKLRGARRRLAQLVFDRTRDLYVERDRSDFLLYSLLPPEVAEDLKGGVVTPPQQHADATVLFADIVQFSEFCASHTPVEVIRVLSIIYSHFDKLIAELRIVKVDVVGDM